MSWIEASLARVPKLARVDLLWWIAGFAVPLWLLDTTLLPGEENKTLRYAIPLVGVVVGFFVGSWYRGKFSAAHREPALFLDEWDHLRAKGELPQPEPGLQAAIDSLNRIERAGKADAATLTAARSATLQIASAYAKGVTEPEREAALAQLAADVESGAAPNLASVAVPSLSRFVQG